MLTFDDTETEKNEFHCYKSIFLSDVGIENVLVSNQISFDEKSYKYFISYLYYDYKIKPKVYVKSYDGETRWCLLIEDEHLLEKY